METLLSGVLVRKPESAFLMSAFSGSFLPQKSKIGISGDPGFDLRFRRKLLPPPQRSRTGIAGDPGRAALRMTLLN
jgi:hypothetical protein